MERPTPRELRILGAGLAVCAAILVVNALPNLPSVVDDAYISARYARNLVEGHGLVYNPGQPPVEGYTNLLWTLLLAAALALGLPLHGAMVWGGLLFAVVSLVTTLGLAGVIARKWRPEILTAPLLLALCPYVAIAATNGIETSQWLAALTGAAWFSLAAKGRLRWGAGGVVGLLCAVRPEGFAVAPALVGIDLWRRRRSLRKPPTWSLALGTVAVVAALVVWRWHAYGALVPNTYSAKLRRPFFDMVALNGEYLSHYGPLWPAVWALLVLLALSPPHRAARVVVTLIAGGLSLVALSVQLWMPAGRLLLPAFVLAAALIPGWMLESQARPWRRWLAAAAVVAMLVSNVPGLTGSERRYDRHVGVVPGGASQRVAEHIAAHAPPGAMVVIRDAGVFAYYVGSRIQVAEYHPSAVTQPHPDRQRADYRQYVRADPEIIVTMTMDLNDPSPKFRQEERLIRSSPATYRHYGRFQTHPQRYYDLYVRTDIALPALDEALVINRVGAALVAKEP